MCDANLIRSDFWDDRWTYLAGAEMVFAHLIKDSIYRAKPHTSHTCNAFTPCNDHFSTGVRSLKALRPKRKAVATSLR